MCISDFDNVFFVSFVPLWLFVYFWSLSSVSDFRVVGVLGVFGEAPQRARDRLGGEMKCPVTVNLSFELAMSTSPFCESASAFQGFTGFHRGQAQLELVRHGSIKG